MYLHLISSRPVLSEVSGEGMIVLILEDSELEVIGVWYKDTTI